MLKQLEDFLEIFGTTPAGVAKGTMYMLIFGWAARPYFNERENNMTEEEQIQAAVAFTLINILGMLNSYLQKNLMDSKTLSNKELKDNMTARILQMPNEIMNGTPIPDLLILPKWQVLNERTNYIASCIALISMVIAITEKNRSAVGVILIAYAILHVLVSGTKRDNISNIDKNGSELVSTQKTMIDGMKRCMDAREATIDGNIHAIDGLRSVIDTLERKIRDQGARILDLEAQATEKEARIADLEAQAVKKEARIALLEEAQGEEKDRGIRILHAAAPGVRLFEAGGQTITLNDDRIIAITYPCEPVESHM